MLTLGCTFNDGTSRACLTQANDPIRAIVEAETGTRDGTLTSTEGGL